MSDNVELTSRPDAAQMAVASAINLPGLYAALDSASTVMTFSTTDWRRHANDAWLHGILIGWDGDPGDPDGPGAWQSVAEQHGWDAATLDRLRGLRAAVAGLTIDAIGELYREHDMLRRRVASAAPTASCSADVRAELGRMDAKASTLLGWSGTAAAVGVAALSQTHLPLAAAALGWTAVGQVALAVALLALAIRPRLDGNYGFVVYAKADPADLPAVAASSPETEARTLVWLSRRVRSGYRAVRAAVNLLLAALPTAAAAAITAAMLR